LAKILIRPGSWLKTVSMATLFWIAANVVGALVYLFTSMALWVPTEEVGKGYPGGPGDAFYWLFYLVPILALFLLINLVAVVRMIRVAYRRRTAAPLIPFAFVVVLWGVVLLVDHLKSYRVITIGV
jgi:hypothetical protein